MKKYLKLRKHTFKNIDKCLFNFPLNSYSSIALSKTCVSNARGRPGYANAKPPGRDKIANVPPPRLTT